MEPPPEAQQAGTGTMVILSYQGDSSVLTILEQQLPEEATLRLPPGASPEETKRIAVQDRDGVLVEMPFGQRALFWRTDDNVQITIQGPLSEDALLDLAETLE